MFNFVHLMTFLTAVFIKNAVVKDTIFLPNLC